MSPAAADAGQTDCASNYAIALTRRMASPLQIGLTNMSKQARTAVVLGIVMTVGCTASDPGDGEFDRYIVGGKADTGGIQEATPEAGAVLRLATSLSTAQLENDVGLADNTVTNIIAYRTGDDEQPGTSDDEKFETLGELDAIPFVGPIAFEKLLAYAESKGLVNTPSTIVNDPFDPTACQGPNVTVAGAEARFRTNKELGNYSVQLRTRTCASPGNCGAWQPVSRSVLSWTEADAAGVLRLDRWDAGSPVKLYVSDSQCESPSGFNTRFSIGSVCDGIGTNKISCNVYDVPGTCIDVGEDSEPRRLRWEGSQFLFYGKFTENCAQLISHRVTPTKEYEAAILTRF